ncbi:MAG: phosphoribosyltransferase family protein [Clostridiaceae bacterium]|nr:phosphoribosyltransferase family protein [Clostridiaceae bacterium]
MNARSILFPQRCILCGSRLSGEALPVRLCRDCLASLTGDFGFSCPVSRDFPCVAACRYAAVAGAVRAFKFSRRREYAPTFAWLMALAYRRRAGGLPPCDAITWVPVSALRCLLRGYDQSCLLARELARLLNLPCVPLLRKLRHTRRQSHLDGDEARARNVRGAYASLGPPPGIARVLLVDDVVTSGATLREAAAALDDSGISSVALCFACARPGDEEADPYKQEEVFYDIER